MACRFRDGQPALPIRVRYVAAWHPLTTQSTRSGTDGHDPRSASELQIHDELHNAAGIQSVRDLAEGRRREQRHGRIELWMIRQVESCRAERHGLGSMREAKDSRQRDVESCGSIRSKRVAADVAAFL